MLFSNHSTSIITIVAVVLAVNIPDSYALYDKLTGEPNPKSFSRKYITSNVDGHEFTDIKRYAGGTNSYSFATVKYGEETCCMKCRRGTHERDAFDLREHSIRYLTY
jgi:hypothetical protein